MELSPNRRSSTGTLSLFPAQHRYSSHVIPPIRRRTGPRTVLVLHSHRRADTGSSAGCAPRRNVTGKQSDQKQQSRSTAEGRQITCGDSVHLVLEQPSDSGSSGDADSGAQ